MLKLRSRNIRLAAAGCLLLAIALYFAIDQSEQKNGDVSGTKRAPTTKPHPRDRDERMIRTKNPCEEFEAARKRGMTEEEVRWVVEDFDETRLWEVRPPDAPAEDLYGRRKNEQKWYLDTLVKGFGLTGEQKKEAKRNLREALIEDFAAYSEAEKAGDAITIYFSTGDPFQRTVDPTDQTKFLSEATPAASLLGVSLWLSRSRMAPWNLCKFEESQQEIGWNEPMAGKLLSKRMGVTTKDPGTDECYEDLDDPFGENPISLAAAGSIFPLSMGQVDRMRAAKKTYKVKNGGVRRPQLLDEVKVLTAPQLRTVLLYTPSLVEDIRENLVKSADDTNGK